MTVTDIKALFETLETYTHIDGLLAVVKSNNPRRRSDNVEYEVRVNVDYVPTACYCCKDGQILGYCPDWKYNKKKQGFCGHMQAADMYCEQKRALLWNDPLVWIVRNGQRIQLRWNQLTASEQSTYQSQWQ
jgi:hypothetical protein